MKIAVIGSTGKAGSRIVKEGRERGHTVIGISRNEKNGIQKDLFTLTAEDVQEYDVVISAFATWDDQYLHLKAAMHLDSIMSGLKSRWITVGGAGSLYAAEGLRLMDSEGFPSEYKGVAEGMAKGLDFLLKNGVSNWSHFSPPAEFAPGEKTGKYRFGEDRLLTGSDGISAMSMEDYASAMIDVIEQNRYNKKRFTAVQA